jgi:predicted enzyme related to lactoylglutathione lyase
MRRFRWLVLIFSLQAASLAWAQVPGSYIPGKFVQADLLTNDLKAVMPFYSGLFGWTFQEHADYAVVFAGDNDMGTIFQRELSPDATRKPRWIAYMSVPDVGIAQQVVIQHGGRTLLAPRTVPELGTVGIFTDAEGAVFGAIHRDGGDPEDYLAEPGEWIWIQLLSRDAVRAGEFYAQLAPYELVDNAQSERSGSYLLLSQEYARAGLVTIPADRTEIQPTWLPFVRVESIAAATARAQQLGGKVLVVPRPDLADGKVAVLADPTGAAIGILEWQYAAAPREQLP